MRPGGRFRVELYDCVGTLLVLRWLIQSAVNLVEKKWTGFLLEDGTMVLRVVFGSREFVDVEGRCRTARKAGARQIGKASDWGALSSFRAVKS